MLWYSTARESYTGSDWVLDRPAIVVKPSSCVARYYRIVLRRRRLHLLFASSLSSLLCAASRRRSSCNCQCVEELVVPTVTTGNRHDVHIDDGDALPCVIVPTHCNSPSTKTLLVDHSDEKKTRLSVDCCLWSMNKMDILTGLASFLSRLD